MAFKFNPFTAKQDYYKKIISYTRRHETTAQYDYLGFAPADTSESATIWVLTRLTLDSSGVSAVMHAADSWDNRVTATYS